MPWSGSGNFTRVHDWTDDRDAAVKILASRHDAEDDNFQAGIQACLAKNGENAATANLPMGGFAHTGVANGTARTQYGAIAQIQDGALHYAVASGTDTYTASLAPAITAYVNGMTIAIKFTNANTGAATLNLNSVGAIAIRKYHDQALIAGDIEANSIALMVYNSTIPCLEIVGPISRISTFIDTLLDDADAATARATLGAAGLTTAQTFTATQTIESTDVGAGAGPDLQLYRNSASPAAADRIGRMRLQGEDSVGNTEDYAQIEAEIVDPTSTSEDARIHLRTVIAGTLADRAYVGAGIVVGSATGGDPGAGKLNATELQVNGTPTSNNIVQATKTDTTSTTSTTFTDITGISVSITPRTTSKRVKVTVSLCIGGSGENIFLLLLRGSTGIFLGDAAGSRDQATTGVNAPFSTAVDAATFSYIDSPATTSATTYKVQWQVQSGAQTAYLNRTATDTDNSGFVRGASSIIAEEID